MEIKILLIQPKMKKRPMDSNLKSRMAPSLALLTLKKCTSSQHTVTIVNENIEDIDFSVNVDIVAITITVDVLPKAIEISQKFQDRGVKTIAGGIHVTADPDSCMGFFDAICVGAAEQCWQDILQDCESNHLHKIYRSPSICEIVSPDYAAIDKSKYLYCNIISTSRGCPFRCGFCYNSCDNSIPYTTRPIQNVINEIQALNTKHILFIDDNFLGDPNWTKEFLTRIKPLHLKWNAAVTANIIKHLDILDLMKETGCQSLFIGFETTNQNALNLVSKYQNDTSTYENLIHEIHSRGIMINASIVFGLPSDDCTVFDSTFQWVMAHKIETVTAHILTPYPGTTLYKQMMAENKIVDFDLSHYNTAHVVFTPENMTAKELYDGYLSFYRQLYSTANIMKRLPKDRKQWIPYLLFNFMYRKFGKFTETLSFILPLNLIGKIAAKLSYRTK